MDKPGCELRVTKDGKGDGVFTIRDFLEGETVVVGVVARRVAKNHSHATQIGVSEYVELADLGPRVNHSCDPNCGVRLNETGMPDLVAREFIPLGEELTFDYATRNYSIDHFPSHCCCGSPICRGSVTGWKDLPDERRRAYGDLVSPYLRRMESTVETVASS